MSWIGDNRYRNKAKYSDVTLFQLISGGDEDAFCEIYNRYWLKLLEKASSRLHSLDAAEDTVQDIFVQLYAKRHELAGVSNPNHYLFTALKYKVYSQYRTQVLHHRYVDHHLNNFSTYTNEDTEQYQTNRELLERIKSITEKMPRQCRMVYRYSREYNMSQREISEKLGISLSTVKKHITKALGMMKVGLRNFLFCIPLLLLFV